MSAICRGRAWSSAIAVLAAYLLVVQAAVGGLAQAAAAAPARADFFGGIICSAGAPKHVPDLPADRSHSPNCCTLGCGMAAPVALPPSANIVPAPLANADSGLLSLFADRVIPGFDRRSAKARAPPQTI